MTAADHRYVIGKRVVIAEVVVGAKTGYRREATRKCDRRYAFRISRIRQRGLDVRRIALGDETDCVIKNAATAPGPRRFVIERRRKGTGPANDEAASRRIGLCGRNARCEDVGEQAAWFDGRNRVVQKPAA